MVTDMAAKAESLTRNGSLLDLIGLIPVPVLLVLGAGAAYAAWRYAGTRAALVAAGAFLLAIVARMGRDAEKEDAKLRKSRETIKSIEKAMKEERAIAERSNQRVEEAEGRRNPRLHDAPDIVSGDKLPDWSKRH